MNEQCWECFFMCSICGMIDFKEKPSNEILTKMGSVMKSRGPDATEQFSDEAVALHHNRLSVMDPKNGHQPMRAVFEGRGRAPVQLFSGNNPGVPLPRPSGSRGRQVLAPRFSAGAPAPRSGPHPRPSRGSKPRLRPGGR